MTVHVLKTIPRCFADVRSGRKAFEFRKDDREPRFTSGDVVVLAEWDEQIVGGWTASPPLVRRIGYVLRAEDFMPEGVCVFGLEPAEVEDVRIAAVVTRQIVVSK